MQNRYRCIFLIVYYTSLCCSLNNIAPGVTYQHMVTSHPTESIHILTVNPHKVHIKIGIAHNICASAQTTTAIAEQHHAIAAINGGFFDFGSKNKLETLIIKILDNFGYSKYNAYPMYTLYVNNNYSLSHIFTGAISWNNSDQHPSFGIIKSHIDLTINGIMYPVQELNKPHSKVPTLYSDCYDKTTPLFHHPVNEIVIQDNQIITIHTTSYGKTNIPKNGFIYVIPKKYNNLCKHITNGDNVVINILHNKYQNQNSPTIIENWNNKDIILASTPLLIHNESIPPHIFTDSSSFYKKQHPRSAVGILKDKNWIFLVVDGRQKKSKGFTIIELAEFMKKLGCTQAINLDGGNSSTMVIDNKIINSPSTQKNRISKKERFISNAIVICTK